MAKPKRKKFKDLTFEEKVDIDLGTPDDSSIRKKFRRRRKAGTLADVIEPDQRGRGTGAGISTILDDAPLEQIENQQQYGSQSVGGKVGVDGAESPSEIAFENMEVDAALAHVGRYSDRDTIDPIEFDENIKLGIDRVTRLNTELSNDSELRAQVSDEVEKVAQLVSPDKDISAAELQAEEVVKSMTVSEISDMGTDLLDTYADDPDDPRLQSMIREYRDATNQAKIKGVEPAVERLGLQDYYPLHNQPLQVGAYSGSIVGSNPIFAAGGGYIPIGVFDARKRALEGAAKKKAERKDNIMKMLFAKGAVQYQDQIDNISMDILNKYGEDTNWDFSKLLDMDTKLSREFWKDVVEHQSFAKRTIRTDKIVNEIHKKEQKDNAYVPDSTRRCLDNWNSGMLNIDEFAKDKRNFKKTEGCIKAYDSMTYYGNQAATKIKRDKRVLKDLSQIDLSNPETAQTYAEAYEMLSSNANYDLRAKATLLFLDEEALKNIVDVQFRDHPFYIDPNLPKEEAIAAGKEEMKLYIAGLIGSEMDIQALTARKYNTELLALKRARFSREKAKDLTILTTAYNQQSDPDFINSMVSVSSMTQDKKVREDNYKRLFKKKTGTHLIVDENGNLINGEIRAEFDLSPEQRKTAAWNNAGQVQWNNIRKDKNNNPIGWQSYSEYNSYLKTIPTENLTDTEKEFMNLSPDDDFQGAIHSATKEQSFRNNDASFTVLTSNDDAQRMASATPTATFNYGGTVTKLRKATKEEMRATGKRNVEDIINLPQSRNIVDLSDGFARSFYDAGLNTESNEYHAGVKQGSEQFREPEDEQSQGLD